MVRLHVFRKGVAMDVESASTVGPEQTRRSMRQPHWCVLMRWGAISLVVANLSLFLLAVPSMYRMLHTAPPEVQSSVERVGLSLTIYALLPTLLNATFSLLCLGVAAVIVWRAAHEGMARFAALCLVQFGAMSVPFAVALRSTYPALVHVAEVSALLSWSAAIVLMHVFPNGQFVPAWSRWWVLLCIAGLAIALILGRSLAQPDSDLVGVIILGGFVSGAIGQIYQYRRVSTTVQRQQTKWIMFGIAAVAMAQTAFVVLYPINWSPVPAAFRDTPYWIFSVGSFGVAVAYMVIPLTIGIAVLRYRLWDIDPLINRTLVYGVLTTSIVGVYALIVATLGRLFQTQANFLVSLVATGIVVVIFQPLRERLQRAINRLMYGERDEPYAVLSRLGQRLEATLAPDAILPTIVQTVKEALKLPYVAIALGQGEDRPIVAAAGTPAAPPIAVSLTYQHEPVGQLLLAPRAAGEAFTPADQRLVHDLARQAGVAVHAVRLTTDLQRARERLVTAREEERRRLRRDLHDGLGPALATITMQADAACSLLRTDPDEAEILLHALTLQAQTTITDVRRLIHALRPPVLDDLGLVAALHALAAAVGSQLCLTIDAPPSLPPLPAAVEVAAYRIAQEALTNVVKHAQARHCEVRLTLDHTLQLAITDDGRGITPQRQSGVGLHSMRERAAELGGRVFIEGAPNGGTRVRVVLPCSEPASHQVELRNAADQAR